MEGADARPGARTPGAAAAAELPPHGVRKTVVAASFGSVLEWYDFSIYGVLAVVLAPLFFPADEPLTSLLATFGVFALGFAVRPLGSIVFGHLGDRIGRRRALLVAITMVTVPTVLIGLLPTYDEIGVAAPILLVLLRCIQGLSAAGEFTGAIVYLAETAPSGRRGVVAATVQASTGLGILTGTVVATVLSHALSQPELSDWGWRVAFLGAAVLGVAGLLLRRHLGETPSFESTIGLDRIERLPLLRALRTHGRLIGLTILLAAFPVTGFYLASVFTPSWYVAVVGGKLSNALLASSMLVAMFMPLTLIGGRLGDRFGRRPPLIVGAIAFMAAAYPIFLLAEKAMLGYLILGYVIFALCATTWGAYPAYMAELFPTRIRYSAVGFAYNVSAALFAGTAPLIATALVKGTGYRLVPAVYLIVISLLGLIAVLALPNTHGRLAEDDP